MARKAMPKQKRIALQRKAGQIIANANRSGSPAQKALAKKYADSYVKRSLQSKRKTTKKR